MYFAFYPGLFGYALLPHLSSFWNSLSFVLKYSFVGGQYFCLVGVVVVLIS